MDLVCSLAGDQMWPVYLLDGLYHNEDWPSTSHSIYSKANCGWANFWNVQLFLLVITPKDIYNLFSSLTLEENLVIYMTENACYLWHVQHAHLVHASKHTVWRSEMQIQFKWSWYIASELEMTTNMQIMHFSTCFWRMRTISSWPSPKQMLCNQHASLLRSLLATYRGKPTDFVIDYNISVTTVVWYIPIMMVV